jgi:O-antigen/teichoic acid export membrane protein
MLKLINYFYIKKYFINFPYFFFSNILSQFFSFYVLINLTNNYAPEELKNLFISQNIFLILYSISFSNVYYSIINNYKKKSHIYKKNFIENFFLHLNCSLVIFFCLIFFLIFLNINTEFKIILIIINIGLIIEPLTLFYYDLFLKEKIKVLFFVKFLSIFLGTSLKLYLIKYHYSLTYIGVAYIIENLFYMLLIIFLFNFYNKKFSFTIRNISFFEQIYKNRYLPILGLSVFITLRLDILFVNLFLDSKLVTIYSTVSRPVIFFYALSAILSKFLYPLYYKLNYNSKVDYDNFYKFIIIFFFFIYSFFFIISAYLRSHLLILFGQDYLLGKNLILYLIILSFFCSIINEWFGRMMLVGFIRKIVMFHIISIFLSFVLNYYFILIWGLDGVAVSVLFSVIFAFLVVNLNQPKEIFLFFSFISFSLYNIVKEAIRLIFIKKKPKKLANKKS